jgi:large subunit ribosomal protein L23
VNAYHIIRRPLTTEKSTVMQERGNLITFEVDRRANRAEVKKAIEKLFNVEVAKVNTSVVRGKAKRRGRNLVKMPSWKKAFVTLKPGFSIDLFEGV